MTDTITPKVSYEKAKKNKYVPDLPAGWIIYAPETGKNLSTTRYPTETAALAAVPQVLAAYLKRIADNARSRAAATAPSSPAPVYSEVRNSTFGTGRRYHSQPGATQYDDGSGHYSVQIWDNA